MSTTSSDPKRPSINDLLGSLRTARDTAHVQLHLFSMEAKQRWQDLERRLDETEVHLNHAAGAAEHLSSESATAKVRELTHAVKSLLREGMVHAEVTTPIRAFIKQTPQTCSPDDSLAQAAKLLWERDCGALPVTDGEGRVVGMLTDRDMCMAAFTRGLPLHAMSVASTMSTKIHTAAPDDSLAHVARIMSKHQVRRVPVIESGKLVGLVSLADIAEHIHDTGQGGMPSSVVLMQALAGICARRPETTTAQAAE